MFVSRKKYDKAISQVATATVAIIAATQMIEMLTEQVQELKGKSQVFTPDEIKTLITLCHPDKHGGKDSAHRMTQKLLQLRK